MNFREILKWLNSHHKKVSAVLGVLLVLAEVSIFLWGGDVVWGTIAIAATAVNVIVYRVKKVPGLAGSLCYTFLLAVGIAVGVAGTLWIPLPSFLNSNIFISIITAIIVFLVVGVNVPGRCKAKAEKLVGETMESPLSPEEVCDNYLCDEDSQKEVTYETYMQYSDALSQKQDKNGLFNVSERERRLRLLVGGMVTVIALISVLIGSSADDGIADIWKSWVFWCLIGGLGGLIVGPTIILGGFLKGLAAVGICIGLFFAGVGAVYFGTSLYLESVLLFIIAVLGGIWLLLWIFRRILKRILWKQRFSRLFFYRQGRYETVCTFPLKDVLPIKGYSHMIRAELSGETEEDGLYILADWAAWYASVHRLVFAGARQDATDSVTELYFIAEAAEKAERKIRHSLRSRWEGSLKVAVMDECPEKIYNEILYPSAYILIERLGNYRFDCLTEAGYDFNRTVQVAFMCWFENREDAQACGEEIKRCFDNARVEIDDLTEYVRDNHIKKQLSVRLTVGIDEPLSRTTVIGQARQIMVIASQHQGHFDNWYIPDGAE